MFDEADLFRCNQIPQSAKTLIAETAQDDQMFGMPEGSVSFSIVDDALSQALADARQRFQFVRRCGVDVDSRTYVRWRRLAYGRLHFVRLLVTQKARISRPFDASRKEKYKCKQQQGIRSQSILRKFRKMGHCNTSFQQCKLLITREMINCRWRVHFAGNVAA